MYNINYLKKDGLEILKSSLNPDQKKAIESKFNNISGKTGRYYVPETLFQKRTSRTNRCLIPFDHIRAANISYKELKTIDSGVVVEFVNNDYFDQLSLSSDKQNDVFKKLKNKLGCDDKVSAIIDIRSTGSSSSQTQRSAYDTLKNWLCCKKLKEKDVLLQRKKGVKYSGKGNDKWEGFLYYNIKGGQQDGMDSHMDNGINPKDVQLFNPSVEYARKDVSDDITLVLIYFALFSIPKKDRNIQIKDPQKTDKTIDWLKVKTEYENYFKTRIYKGFSLYDYVTTHISLNLIKDTLMDPIRIEPINIEDFTRKKRDDDAVDIAHQSSVMNHNYIWDQKLNVLLTPARPTNLFWSKHISNMMQQNYSLKNFILSQINSMNNKKTSWTTYMNNLSKQNAILQQFK